MGKKKKKKVSFLVCFNQFPLTREASKQDFKGNVLLDPKLWSQDVKGPEERKLWSGQLVSLWLVLRGS